MASEKEITSTEKLLKVIRGESGTDKTVQETAPSGPTYLAKPTGKRKGLSIGVDIGYTHVRFVKVSQATGKELRLLDYRSVPIPADSPRGTPGFRAFLKDALYRFCGPPRGVRLWALMSAAGAEVRNISVPRVTRKELPNAVLWSAKKELDFKEGLSVFDYEIQGEVMESGVAKYSILFYAVPRKDVDETSALFDGVGYPLSGLTIAPLAIQNIFRTDWIPARDRTVASLYIGRDWSRIDIFSGGNLVMTRGIKAGLNSMAESLIAEHSLWRKRQGLGGSDEIAMPGHEDRGIVLTEPSQRSAPREMTLEDAGKLLRSLSPDSRPEDELARACGMDNESIFSMITPALERLVRQLERTFDHYAVSLGRERISAFYVSMGMNACQPIIDYIGTELGIPSDILDPLDPDHSRVGRLSSRENLSDRSAYVPVLGAALSPASRALNLIYTRQDSEKRKKYVAANSVVLGLVLLVMAGGIGWYAWLNSAISEKKAHAVLLERKLADGPKISDSMLTGIATDLRTHRTAVTKLRERYLATALFSDISALTPPDIKLTGIRADLGREFEGTGMPELRWERPSRSMLLDGFVTGGKDDLEANLISYIMVLQSSPLFERVVINNSDRESLDGRNVLRFVLTAFVKGARDE